MNPTIIIVWIGISIGYVGKHSPDDLKVDLYPSEKACKESTFLHENRQCVPIGSTAEYFAYVEKQYEEKIKNSKIELELKEKLKYEMCMENVPKFIPKDGDNYKVFEFRCHQKVYGNKK